MSSLRQGDEQGRSSISNSFDRPKTITAFMYLPKRNYYLLNLEIRNRLGDLAAVSKVLADSRIEILNGSFIRGVAGKPGTWQVFVEPLNPNTKAEEIKHLLLSVPDVKSCLVKQSKDGLLVDTLTFPVILSSGQRAMIMRNDIWNGMLRKTREKFSSGADVIIYDQGLSAGKITGRELLTALGKEKVIEHVDEIIGMYQALGWGKARVMEFDQNPFVLVVRMSESAECTGQKSERPTSHFIRGHMLGVAEEIFGVEAKCTETSCVSQGNKYCEYLLEEKKQRLSD